MKITTLLFIIILWAAGTSVLAARGDNSGTAGGQSPGNHGGQKYRGSSVYIAIPGSLLLGNSFIPPSPGAAGYEAPYLLYGPGGVPSQPGVCFEERTVYGDGGRIGREDGRRFWSTSPYPMLQRVPVPCP